MWRDFQNRNNPIWGFWGGGSLLSKNKNASTVHYVISACLRDSSIPGSKEVWPSFSDENLRLRKAEEPVQGELRSWLPLAHFPWDDTLYPSRSVSSLSPCIKILGCKWQKLTSSSLSKGGGGIISVCLLYQTSGWAGWSRFSGRSESDLNNSRVSLAPPLFLPTFHLCLSLLASFFSYCRWASSTLKVMPWSVSICRCLYSLWPEKIRSLPPSLSLKNPREEFWLAWPRSCALWQSDTAKWIKSWKAGLYHKPRESHRPCPGGIVIKQAGPAVFCLF